MATDPAGALDSGTPNVSGQSIADYARTFIGVPYVFGGTTRKGVDCSGLVKLVYSNFGIDTPRTTADMVGPKSNLQPIDRGRLGIGDLITSHWPGETRPSSHVAIYAGNGTVIEAPEPGKTVMVSNLSDGYWSHVDQILHVPGVDSGATGSASGGGVIGNLTDLAGGAINTLTGWIPNPKTLTDAAVNIGTAAGNLAGSAQEVSHLANMAARVFLPSNLLRGAMLFAGTVFILIGILFLAKEVSDA
jgi:hypothetical protein